MKRLLLFIVMLAAVSAAIDRADFKLDYVISDWGHGCQYYTVDSMSLAASETIAKPTASTAAGATSQLRNSDWEMLVTKNLSRQVWQPNVKCTNTTTANGTVETCTDTGKYVTEYYLSDAWESMAVSYSYPAKVKTRIRFCSDYDMKPLDGGWGARIDVIPSFAAYSFPEYEWFNITYRNRSCTNFTSSNAAASYSINATTMGGYGPEIRWTTNASGTEQLIGGWAKMENESLNRYILNVSLSNGTTQVCYYYGNTTPVETSPLANYSVACHAGDTWDAIDTTLYDTSGSPAAQNGIAYGNVSAGGTYIRSKTAGIDISRKKYVMESYLRMNESIGSWGYIFGAFSNDLSDSIRIRFAAAKNAVLENDGSEGATVISWSDAEWANLRIELNSSAARYYRNGTLLTSRTTNMPNENLEATPLYAYGTNTTQREYSEWFCVYDLTTPDGLNITYTEWVNETAGTQPSIIYLSVAPSPIAYTDDILNCSYTVNDTDSMYLNLSIYWYLNGSRQDALNITRINIIANTTGYYDTLGVGNTSQNGENWSCSVNASDGTYPSGMNFSLNTTIVNGQPWVGPITILPSPSGVYALPRNCSFTVYDNDTSDVLDVWVSWYRNGTWFAATNYPGRSNGSSITDSMLLAAAYNYYNCSVNVTDGWGGYNVSNSSNSYATDYPVPDAYIVSPATTPYATTNSTLYIGYVCNDTFGGSGTAQLWFAGAMVDSEAFVDNAPSMMSRSGALACNNYNYFIYCSEAVSGYGNNSATQVMGVYPAPALSTPADGFSGLASASVAFATTAGCAPASALLWLNGTNHTMACGGTSSCSYTNTSRVVGTYNWTAWYESATGAWYIASSNRTLYATAAPNYTHYNVTINLTQNYTIAGFQDYMETFYEDWLPYALGILSFGFAFMVVRVTKNLSHAMIAASMGLLFSFMLTGNVLLLAAGMLILVIGFLLKYVIG